MKLSIVILNYNACGLLKQCVRSIELSDLRVEHEIMIVDNASWDDSLEMAQHELPHVKLISSPHNLGYGGGINLGLKSARGDYVLMLNPDVMVMHPAIETLIAVLESDAQIGIVAPQLLHPDKTIQWSCFRFPRPMTPVYRRTFLGKTMWGKRELRRFMMLDWDHQHGQTVDWVLGGAMLARRAELLALGGFDERFFLYFEDVDLCRRFWQRGQKVMYCPAAHMVHYHKRESAKRYGVLSLLDPLTRVHIRSALQYFAKWKSQPEIGASSLDPRASL